MRKIRRRYFKVAYNKHGPSSRASMHLPHVLVKVRATKEVNWARPMNLYCPSLRSPYLRLILFNRILPLILVLVVALTSWTKHPKSSKSPI